MIDLKVLRNTSPIIQLMTTIFVVILSTLVLSVLGFITGIFIFDIDIMGLSEAMADISNPENVAIMKYFQTINSIGIFIVPAIIIAFILADYPWKYLKLDRVTGIVSILLVIIIVYFALPLINYLSELNSLMSLPEWLSGLENSMRAAEDSAAGITEAFLAVDSFNGLLFNLFMIGLLPAVGEELLFRGVIQRLLKDITRSNHAAIWISAIFFSALHLQFYGFLPRMLLGAMFGYLLVWGGSLWYPIIAHFINNASAVIAYYLYHKGTIGQDFDEMGTMSEGNSYLAFVSLALVIILMRMFYIREKGKEFIPG